MSAPEYWVGPVLVLVFARYLGWLPSGGWDGLTYIVLPAVALALRPLGYFTQVTRAAMTDVLTAPYITAARSRGLSFPPDAAAARAAQQHAAGDDAVLVLVRRPARRRRW